ncbi:hypothetical protein P8A22_16950 [Streptomyces laculatispora]|uniref:Uncharacterized protein n=1 Tax=Streptomyces laculatispora TaxID=887464 RepID=A0ABY9I3V8_9ACTN|nr:hypothetical protein [Streptomyces laculatispora]WLQ41520.1 hypothetical protein P8A22_16950 [Streptomyces laculatispora]
MPQYSPERVHDEIDQPSGLPGGVAGGAGEEGPQQHHGVERRVRRELLERWPRWTPSSHGPHVALG